MDGQEPNLSEVGLRAAVATFALFYLIGRKVGEVGNTTAWCFAFAFGVAVFLMVRFGSSKDNAR